MPQLMAESMAVSNQVLWSRACNKLMQIDRRKNTTLNRPGPR